MILNFHDWSDRVQSVTNTKEDNDVINHIGVVYVENDIEISWLIELGGNYDENQTE